MRYHWTLKQIRISNRAALIEIPEGATDSTQPETGGAGSTTKQVPTSLLINLKDYTSNLFPQRRHHHNGNRNSCP